MKVIDTKSFMYALNQSFSHGQMITVSDEGLSTIIEKAVKDSVVRNIKDDLEKQTRTVDFKLLGIRFNGKWYIGLYDIEYSSHAVKIFHLSIGEPMNPCHIDFSEVEDWKPLSELVTLNSLL